MSKFSIKVKLQSLEIEVEGSREDVPRLAGKVGEQFGNLITPALLLEASEDGKESRTEADANSVKAGKGRARRKKSGAGSTKTSTDEISVSIDPAKHGSPIQGWGSAQKAIWFLHIVATTSDTKQMTGYSIAKSFNKHFKAAGALDPGNVNKALDKERLKGTDATVGADMSDGVAKYYLTQAGTAMALQLIKGESPAAA